MSTVKERLLSALEAVNARCDGAASKDGQGYGRYDVGPARALICKPLFRWTEADVSDAMHLCQRYNMQLAELGHDIGTIMGDEAGVVELADDISAINRQAAANTQAESGAERAITSPEAIKNPGTSDAEMIVADNTPIMLAGNETQVAEPVEVKQPAQFIKQLSPTITPIIEIDPSLHDPQEIVREREERKKAAAVVIDGGGADVPTYFLTGIAGSGKTYEIRRRIAEDANYGQMSATTGIAAINLGTITLNSLLKYFDTDSLEQALIDGGLERSLMRIAAGEIETDFHESSEGVHHLIIDEVSMLDAKQLDYIYEATRRVNERLQWAQKPLLGIVLTGDFCQLPPVKAEWAFKAQCWPSFDANTERLTKCWRQSDQRFLDALNLIRSGNGRAGADLLKEIGVEFAGGLNTAFDGTTIIAKNEGVNGFNFAAHLRVPGRVLRVRNTRWGQLRSEWKYEVINGKEKGSIPNSLELKIGAYVMVLINDAPNFTYVNGDCGHITDFIPSADDQSHGAFIVKLRRTGQEVKIGRCLRHNLTREMPRSIGDAETRGLRAQHHYDPDCDPAPNGVRWDVKNRKWVIGGVCYYPLRLAYATTVHKSQGLSLDTVQIDLYNHFLGTPAMAYVALSRAKDPAGLRLVGNPELLAQRVKTNKEVLRWL